MSLQQKTDAKPQTEKFRIVFAIYPGMTQLDFTGPLQVFSSLPGANVHLI